MKICETNIEDTFAEAFDVAMACVVITATDRHWLNIAVAECTGYGTSVIGCDVEAGLACYLNETETVDGRVGARVMFFGFSKEKVIEAVRNRVGQTVMTCVGTAVFEGLCDDEKTGGEVFSLGGFLKYFGDGYEKKTTRFGVKGFEIPVTAGIFFCVNECVVRQGIGGGNLLVCGIDEGSCLKGVERGVLSVCGMPSVVLPFGGGVVRSASKVGSKYKGLVASTNEKYCPSLKDEVEGSLVGEDINCIYEIIINGLDVGAVAIAMGRMIPQIAMGSGIIKITAANFEGKLGKHQIRLFDVLQ